MESIFECGVCFKYYNHNEKKPLSLPCGHTFCYDCLKKINKNSQIKCPFDKSVHPASVDSLPVNYAVLTALPSFGTNNYNSQSPNQGESNGLAGPTPTVAFCDVHKNKKVKFYCKNDMEMFCSKCVLKHTNQKHEVMPCSHKILEMKKMVSDLLTEVDSIDQQHNVSEDVYLKLE